MSSDITLILRRMSAGDISAQDELYRRVHADLHRMAAGHMRGRLAEHTLQASALLSEAYLRLAQQNDISWEARGQFFATASKAMRSILVDHARTKNRIKRKADGHRVPLDALLVSFEERATDLLDLDGALSRLAEQDPRAERIVDLHFFCGLPFAEIAQMLDVSERTVTREWRLARAWLLGALS